MAQFREPRQKLTLHPAPVGSLQAGDDAQQGELRRQEIEEHVDRIELRIVCRLYPPLLGVEARPEASRWAAARRTQSARCSNAGCVCTGPNDRLNA